MDSDKFTKKASGMPSGHAQVSFFSIVYGYLVKRQFIPWTLLSFIIAFILIYERYVFKNHTVYQLISGVLIGSIFGYISYYIVKIIDNHNVKDS